MLNFKRNENKQETISNTIERIDKQEIDESKCKETPKIGNPIQRYAPTSGGTKSDFNDSR